jgi:hypothetical protein
VGARDAEKCSTKIREEKTTRGSSCSGYHKLMWLENKMLSKHEPAFRRSLRISVLIFSEERSSQPFFALNDVAAVTGIRSHGLLSCPDIVVNLCFQSFLSSSFFLRLFSSHAIPERDRDKSNFYCRKMSPPINQGRSFESTSPQGVDFKGLTVYSTYRQPTFQPRSR